MIGRSSITSRHFIASYFVYVPHNPLPTPRSVVYREWFGCLMSSWNGSEGLVGMNEEERIQVETETQVNGKETFSVQHHPHHPHFLFSIVGMWSRGHRHHHFCRPEYQLSWQRHRYRYPRRYHRHDLYIPRNDFQRVNCNY